MAQAYQVVVRPETELQNNVYMLQPLASRPYFDGHAMHGVFKDILERDIVLPADPVVGPDDEALVHGTHPMLVLMPSIAVPRDAPVEFDEAMCALIKTTTMPAVGVKSMRMHTGGGDGALQYVSVSMLHRGTGEYVRTLRFVWPESYDAENPESPRDLRMTLRDVAEIAALVMRVNGAAAFLRGDEVQIRMDPALYGSPRILPRPTTRWLAGLSSTGYATMPDNLTADLEQLYTKYGVACENPLFEPMVGGPMFEQAQATRQAQAQATRQAQAQAELDRPAERNRKRAAAAEAAEQTYKRVRQAIDALDNAKRLDDITALDAARQALMAVAAAQEVEAATAMDTSDDEPEPPAAEPPAAEPEPEPPAAEPPAAEPEPEPQAPAAEPEPEPQPPTAEPEPEPQAPAAAAPASEPAEPEPEPQAPAAAAPASSEPAEPEPQAPAAEVPAAEAPAAAAPASEPAEPEPQAPAAEAPAAEAPAAEAPAEPPASTAAAEPGSPAVAAAAEAAVTEPMDTDAGGDVGGDAGQAADGVVWDERLPREQDCFDDIMNLLSTPVDKKLFH
jgi:hypothetical protein